MDTIAEKYNRPHCKTNALLAGLIHCSYVRNQFQEDIASDQMCLKEFKDPFTGKSVVKGK